MISLRLLQQVLIKKWKQTTTLWFQTIAGSESMQVLKTLGIQFLIKLVHNRFQYSMVRVVDTYGTIAEVSKSSGGVKRWTVRYLH